MKRLQYGLALALVLGCQSTPASPEAQYFALKATYANAGDLVNAWCAQPATPAVDCAKVDAAMDKAEAQLKALDAVGESTPGYYEAAIAVLEQALAITSQYVEVK